MENTESKIVCKECGKSFSNVGWHVKKVHNLTADEYLVRYPNAPLASEEYKGKQRASTLARYKSTTRDFRKEAGKTTFAFIKDKDLRSLLRRDYKSARVCLENELWKPSIILYGSLIEAILIEMTGTGGTFEQAIEKAAEQKIISDKEYHKIHLIRDLRNFVHLHRELAEKEEINEYWAKTFAEICEGIIRRRLQQFTDSSQALESQ